MTDFSFFSFFLFFFLIQNPIPVHGEILFAPLPPFDHAAPFGLTAATTAPFKWNGCGIMVTLTA